MIKIIYIALSIVLFSGCVSTTIPPINEFRVNANLAFTPSDKKSFSQKSLKVAEAFSPSSLKSLKMKYAYGENKEFVYSQSQWALLPNKAITSEVIKLLKDLELFSSVQSSKSKSRSSMLLEISIDEFMQHFDANAEHSYAKIEMTFTLIDIKTHTIFATKTFKQVNDVDSLNAEGGVRALNAALRALLLDSAIWFESLSK